MNRKKTCSILRHQMPAFGLALLFCVGLLPNSVHAQDYPPRVAIILDDLGINFSLGQRALNLPGQLTYAFLPYTEHGPELAEQAHQQGKEVMLHLPMESMLAKPLGPIGLRMDMTHERVRNNITAALASVPHVAGVNNHMGSLLTRHPGYMQWVMEELKSIGGLYFIDSRTTHHTVAEFIAVENSVPVRRRDVFLDNDPSVAAIRKQFQRLIHRAKLEGSAIGIGHPYDSTLVVLDEMLPQLAAMGVDLVPVSELVPHVYQQTGQRYAATAPDINKEAKSLLNFYRKPNLNNNSEVGTAPAM